MNEAHRLEQVARAREMKNPLQQIRRIDLEIDANRRLPDSRARQARENELFRQRGEAQLARDIAASEVAKRAARFARFKVKRCPECGR